MDAELPVRLVALREVRSEHKIRLADFFSRNLVENRKIKKSKKP